MKKQIIQLTIILFCSFFNFTYAQHGDIDITVHNRVDTTKNKIKEIVALWKNYLNSKPDSIYDNPYWNEAEKEKYKDFDFTRQFVYKLPSDKLLNYYKPTILSIVKKNGGHAIRTLYYAEGLKENYRKSNPWCITEIYAVKENSKWKLKNALPLITNGWINKPVGKINYIYPPGHCFNDTLAQKAMHFCNKVTKKFNLPAWQPFDFYVTSNPDKLGELLGFDFFFVGYTTGMAWKRKRILFSGIGEEFYPHEFMHLILPEANRHKIIEEGMATWQGGANDKTFNENAKILAFEISKNDSITFSKILKQNSGGDVIFYTTGAIICKKAYKKNGAKAIKKLINTPNDDERLRKSLCDIFDVDKKNLNKFIKKEIFLYLE